MREYGRLMAIVAVLAVFLGGTLAAADCLKCAVKGYVEAVQEGDVDRAMSYLAEDFQLRIAEPEATMDRQEVESRLGWDHAVNTRLDLTDLEWEGSTVTVVLHQESDFLELVGLPERMTRVTFRFDDDNLIAEQVYEPLSEPACLCKVVRPVVEWAKANRETELSAVTENGTPVYTAATAGPWLELLEDFRVSVAGSPAMP